MNKYIKWGRKENPPSQKRFQVFNVERVTEKSHYLVNTLVIIISNNDQQGMLTPVGKSMMRNKTLTWSQIISPWAPNYEGET